MRAALIIGQGSIGRRHRKVLCDAFPEARIDIVSLHAVAGHGVFRRLELVPDLRGYDYFVIASKTSEHYSHLCSLDSMVAGKKILVEKPLFAGCEQYVAKQNTIYVGYNLRYHPILRWLKDILSQEPAISINVIAGQYLPTWRPETDYRQSYSASAASGGGVLLDLSHEFDYVQWMCSEIVTVKALSRKISKLEIDSDDYLAMIGETKTGTIATICLDYLSRKPVRRVLAHTQERTIDCDLVAGTVLVQPAFEDNVYTPKQIDRNYTYSHMHNDILLGEAASACNLEEGMAVMSTIERIRKSDRSS